MTNPRTREALRADAAWLRAEAAKGSVRLKPEEALAMADDIEAAYGTVEIVYELGGKFWHTNCPKNTFKSGIMRPVAHEPTQSLIECLHCGQRAYYPVGAKGRVCAALLASLPVRGATPEEKLAVEGQRILDGPWCVQPHDGSAGIVAIMSSWMMLAVHQLRQPAVAAPQEAP